MLIFINNIIQKGTFVISYYDKRQQDDLLFSVNRNRIIVWSNSANGWVISFGNTQSFLEFNSRYCPCGAIGISYVKFGVNFNMGTIA
jgi:hypothetical protein